MTPRAMIALSRTNFLVLKRDRQEEWTDAWPGEFELLDRSRPESRARAIARLVRQARTYDVVVVDGSVGLRKGYVDLIGAAAMGRLPSGPVVVISDATWKRGASPLDWLACRLGIRLVDTSRTVYCVHSRAEVDLFPCTWNVAPERVFFTPWCHILSASELSLPVSEELPIFAGGDSLRDYEPLLAAARELSAPVMIATRRSDVLGRSDLPANVRADAVSHGRYNELMRSARVVVVPLAPTFERSAGQTTYLNAMAMGKLVVVTDILGVRDYVEDGNTGLIVPPADLDALQRVLAWALDRGNDEEVRAIAARAREVVRTRFDPDSYVTSLLRVAREALERRSRNA